MVEPSQDEIIEKEQAEKKLKICVNRCNYIFQATSTETFEINPESEAGDLIQGAGERIVEACLYCSICGHVKDLKFEYDNE